MTFNVTHRDWADASLTSAVDWLLIQCGRTQTECRHACMQLVISLCHCLPGLLLSVCITALTLAAAGIIPHMQ